MGKIVLIGISFILFGICSFIYVEQNPSIIGEWISESDSNSKWVFTDSECLRYSQGRLLNTYSYSISNTSPQCGFEVPVNKNTAYLLLTKKSNAKKYCYEIASLNNEYLTLRPINKGGFMVFVRQ